jgi:signal recognition particle receptor subunit beta
MVNIEDFNQKKVKGLVRILETTEDNIIVAYKQFDLEKAKEGEVEELPEEVSIQSIQELKDQKESLQKQIDEIDSFLKISNAI